MGATLRGPHFRMGRPRDRRPLPASQGLLLVAKTIDYFCTLPSPQGMGWLAPPGVDGAKDEVIRKNSCTVAHIKLIGGRSGPVLVAPSMID